MKSVTTAKFRNLLWALPDYVQDKAFKAYRLWRTNPRHSSLEFKQINVSTAVVLSAMVDLNYRVLGYLSNEVLYWFWIGSHAEYDKIIKSFR